MNDRQITPSIIAGDKPVMRETLLDEGVISMIDDVRHLEVAWSVGPPQTLWGWGS